MQLGDVSLTHPIDVDRSPGTAQGGDLALAYRSSQVSQRPIVQVVLRGSSLPAGSSARLKVNGLDSPVVYLNPSVALTPPLLFALQASQTLTQTGRYTWEVVVQPANQVPITLRGVSYVVAQDASPLGAGWSFAGVDRLVPIDPVTHGGVTYPAGRLRVYGSGGWRFYEGSTSFTSPPGDNGTLAVSGAGFTYTTPDGQVRTFNSSGHQTRWDSADGSENLQYRYDGSGRLTGVTAIDGALATLTYSGLLVTAQTATGRTTTLGKSGAGDLTSITNPGGTGQRAFTYHGATHRVATEAYGQYLSGSWQYTAAGAVEADTWGSPPAFSVTRFVAASEVGLVTLYLTRIRVAHARTAGS
jgi:YD repeat-containing protein